MERSSGLRASRRRLTALLVILLALTNVWWATPAMAATFTVNSAADATDANPGNGVCATATGVCTLRAAIQEANARAGADAITVPAGNYILAIEPINSNEADSGDLDITGPLTISGAGIGNTIISGGTPPAGALPEVRGLDRIFEILPTAGNVTISGLTMRDGTPFGSSEGGAIWNGSTGTLRLQNVGVLNSFSSSYGGGIYSEGGGRLELSNTTVSGNATVGEGGGIFIEMGTLAISGGNIANNSGRTGGGIYNAGVISPAGLRARVEVTGTSITGNLATSAGGGIYNGLEGDLVLTNVTVSTNSTEGDGGGVASTSKSGASITGGLFSSNSALGAGGGLYFATERDLSVSGTTFSGNSAEEGGGANTDGTGAVSIANATFANNQAVADGGGLAINSFGTVDLSNSTVRDNYAQGSAGGLLNSGNRVTLSRVSITGNSAIEDGGGILSEASGEFQLLDSTLSGNRAQNGGGLANDADSTLKVYRTTIWANRALLAGGEDAGYGGGVFNQGDAAAEYENVTISGNYAQTLGGGLFIDADAGVRVINTTITRNAAPVASGVGEELTAPPAPGDPPPVPSTAVIFRNTIVASNTGGSQCNYAIGSEGGNIAGDNSCYFITAGDRNGVQPALDAIADNGGFTLTHEPRAESVAVDGGVNPCPATDQRGITRPRNLRCDSGAVEYTLTPAAPDGIAPDTFITQAPAAVGERAVFGFTGDDGSGTPADQLTFECRLLVLDPTEVPEIPDPTQPPDPALAFLPCASPYEILGINAGENTFEVRAIDRAGNVDPTPARHVFVAGEDVVPPDTEITSGPANPSSTRGATFTFTGTDDITEPALLEFECRLDSTDPTAWLECFSPAVYANLASGQHTLQVRAVDEFDNIDPTPATYTWTIGPPSNCDAANITLGAVADAYVDEGLPLANFGVPLNLAVRSDAPGNDARSLVRFALPTDLPACDLRSATLRLYANGEPGRTLQAFTVAADWQENQVTWQNQPAVSGTPATATSGSGYREWNVTSQVAAMLAGTTANRGWLIRDSVEEDATGVAQSFAARDTIADIPVTPQLVLRFDGPGEPVPAPPTPASGTTAVSCGMVIRQSIRLANGLNNCPGEGLIVGAHNIVVDLNGKTIDGVAVFGLGQEEGIPAGIRNSGYRNVVIKNGTVKEFGTGVHLTAGTTFNVIENLTLTRNVLAGMELTDADNGRNGNEVRNNSFVENELGIAVVNNSENNLVRANTFQGNVGSAVYVFDSSGTRVETNNISGITFDPTLGSDFGIVLEGAPDSVILGNGVSDTGDAGIVVSAGSHRTLVQGNTMSRVGDAGVLVAESDSVDVIGNVAHLASDAGINIDTAEEGVVRGNDVRFNPAGVELGGASRFLVELNDASYSGTGIGMSGGSLDNLIVDNIANATGADGISVEMDAINPDTGAPDGGSLIARNQTHDGGSDGISVLGGGHTLRENDADNNLAYGIRADDGTIDGGLNTARGNGEPPQCVGVACDPGIRAPLIPNDLVEPDTTITARPAASISESTASVFRFTGTDNIAPATALRFECRLDVPDPTSVEGWIECKSPQLFSGLLPGAHSIEVRAVDPFDNADSTPATYSWTITADVGGQQDVAEPNTFIVERPDDPTTATSATFRFRGSDDETAGPSLRFECRLGTTGAFTACVSPVTYNSLTPGLQTFAVRAIDLSNKVDSTPESYSWTILPASADTDAPETSIVSGPDPFTTSSSASFGFSSNEAPVTFECAVNGGAVIDCGATYTFTGLEPGPYALVVVAIDAAGNRDLSPAYYYWEVTAPAEPTAASCGQTITRSIVLTGDLVGCPGDGLVVGADRITIDLDGFTISGTNLGTGIVNNGFDNVTVLNGTLSGFDFGLRVAAGASGSILDGLAIQGNQDAGIVLDGAGSATAGTTVRNVTVGANVAGVIITGGTRGTLITGSVIGGSSGEGLTISASTDNTVTNSTISGSSGTGVLLDNADNNRISFNRIENNRGGGVELTLGSDGNRVEGNTLTENATGIVVSDSNGNVVRSNRAQRTNGNGIDLTNANGNSIGANDVRFNAGGIELFASSNNQIESNNASDASGNGITVGGGSFSNVIYGNLASNNDAVGISVEDLAAAGQGNLIDRNTTSGNSAGIDVAQGGHTIVGNSANNNAGWGIDAADGNTDGGGNSATGNGEPAQCQGVRCDGGTPIPPGPPETELVLTPAASVPNGYAAFTFTGFDDTTLPANLGFQCRLDSALETAWVDCENPVEYFGLASGLHTFEVRAVDEFANVDPTPASFTWTVQLPPTGTAPQTTITFGPGPISVLLDATFAFTSSEPGSTFQCSLDGAPFTACTSPAEYTDLALGQHTFRVAARDAEGDLDQTPATLTWTIVGPPEAIVTAGPDDPTLSSSASFSFTANLAGASFQCSLDSSPFVDCTSPVSYSGLAVGEHLFRVVATANGQQSLEPAEYGWTIDALVDTLAPDTLITLQPTSGTSEATFEFTGTDNETPATALTFECRLDSTLEADFVDCLSPNSLIDLTPGSHTFDVRAIDREGNIDPTPASFTWTYANDTVAPNTTIDTRPDAVTTSTTARFTFAASEPTQRFECALDGAAFAECASPAIYTGLEPGDHSFAVQAVDLAGNVDGSPATFSWIVNAPPETSIVSGPEPVTLERSATFTYESSEPGSSFECAIDNQPFAACGLSVTYNNLAVGDHTFFVRARDSLGLADPSPAAFAWTIGVPPETNINGGPEPQTELTTASFSFSSTTAGVSFLCALDEGAFSPCASGVTYSGLAIGPHVFEVAAVDTDGLIDPTPADYEWEVIAPIPPETTIASGPPPTTTATTASFSFTASEPGATFACSLDGAPFASCSSPRNLTGLTVGEHTFRVQATDAAGATDPTPASYSWEVQVPDTIAPDTTITASPSSTTTSTSATFAFTATEAGSTFQCSLNGGAFGPCTTPTSYTGLATGQRTFAVRGVDPAGNVDPTPATFTWTIQAAATCTVTTVTYQANADAWLEQNGPTSNKGTDSKNKVKSQGPTDNFRTVVRFNLPTSIPAGCQVASATLRMNSPSAVSGRTLQAFRLAGAWAENTITWGNQPATAGTAATTTSGTGNRDWLVTGQVRDIFAAGANYGFLIRDAAESGTGFEQEFYARENSTNRPVLIVQYTQAP